MMPSMLVQPCGGAPGWLCQLLWLTHWPSLQAIAKINPSVSPKDVKRHEEWVKVYGSI
jgi:hypothetical protein